MIRESCTRETEVAAAVDPATWSPELQAHVASCEACQEAAAVTTALHAMLRAEEAEPLPDAGRLWWRSQIEARQEARRRSMRPIDTVERAEPFIAVAVALVLLLLRGDRLGAALAHVLSGEAGAAAAVQAALPAPVLLALAAGLGMTFVMLLVGLGAALARD